MAHKNVTAAVADTATAVTLTGAGNWIVAHNLDGAGYVSFRMDGTAAVLEAEGTYGLGKPAGTEVRIRQRVRGSVVLSAIASVATKVAFRLED